MCACVLWLQEATHVVPGRVVNEFYIKLMTSVCFFLSPIDFADSFIKPFFLHFFLLNMICMVADERK